MPSAPHSPFALRRRMRRFGTLPWCAGLALASMLAASPVLAQDITFTATGAPQPYAIANVQPDVRGLAPGMGEAEARAALAKAYPASRIEATKATITYLSDGVAFRSRPVLTQMTAQASGPGTQEEVTLSFGLPTTGSPLLGIQRRVDFGSSAAAPQVAPLVGQLIEKYGPPSFRRGEEAAPVQSLIWVFGAGKVQPCGTKAPCPAVSATFAIGRLDSYRAAVEEKQDLLIQVDLIVQAGGRVRSFKTTLADNRGAVASYEAAQSQIVAAVDARAAQQGTAPETPKF